MQEDERNDTGQGSASKRSVSMIASNVSSSSSTDSMDVDEHNDKVLHMAEDLSAFRQIDYLWLFDNELKFSERQGFTLDDLNVNIDDFQKMRQINRQVLTEFCKIRD